MAKTAKDPLIEDFLKKYKKHTLSIVQKTIEKEKEKHTITIAIVNDLVDHKIIDKTKGFTKEKKFTILPLSGLWQAYFDRKYELTDDVISGDIIYDYGLVETLRVSATMKQKLLKKFDKYLVSLVLFGSWARGQAVEGSDIDLAVVIDDTDVKETTRIEIREKIRKIVLGEAAEVSKNINIQVYILTQFWEYVRDANPVIFTLLRDGVPILDTGLYSPWKLLLRMGKIKPTPEAIETFISSGKLLTKVVDSGIREMIIEKLYYAMLNPAQAALMFIGIAPPAHSEAPHLLERYFVKTGKLDKKYVSWLAELIKIRKEIEHGTYKGKVNGKLLDKYAAWANEFSEKISKLFEQMRKETISDRIKEIDYLARKGMKQALEAIGIKAKGKSLVERFRKEIIHKKMIPASYSDFVNYFSHVVEDYEKGVVTQEEVNKLERDAHEFIEAMIGFAKIKETAGTDMFKIRCTYGDKEGELWLLKNEVFIIKDVTNPHIGVFRAKLKNDGSLDNLVSSNLSELNEKRTKVKPTKIAKIKEKTLESLKKIFGENVEIILVE